MKNVIKISSIVILSFLLIIVGKGMNFVECAHSHSINFAILSNHSSAHFDCHNNSDHKMTKNCMTYKSMTVSPSQISSNIDLPNIVYTIVALFLPVYQEEQAEQDFTPDISIFKPPADYLKSIGVLII